MAAPKLHIPCCMCGKPLPRTKDNIQLLDAEWQRRFPDITGRLCCFGCVSAHHWWCRPHGVYVDGHIPAVDEYTGRPKSHDKNSNDHLGTPGRLAAMVQAHPRVALAQGAEEYLRHRARLRNLPREGKARLNALLDEWDSAKPQPAAHDEHVDLDHWNAMMGDTVRKLASARRKLTKREQEMAQILKAAREAGVPAKVVGAWETQADMVFDQHED
ncbi:hypothetical protein KIK06_29020 [Nocardiopsis sp. EMB25]|uniref:hypothetical protein n=1 Tax=Nocardiopsis sp. EMB25 TaxID=2835867 RepID=UPI002284FA2D|nr:hypothetical protein [Nocardiopsis sp. EMB25]MCY9787926.1 hypothetical protein [Nocardiopsis sp. EMB25]